mmetsp:Transcript_59659/g.141957  ORF Transcript_59659/g.141957 Transcript_59659/m.141957 type:complete len:275 (+) Transcript_59659:190-1014(+)
MICCPANQRLSSALWQLAAEPGSANRTHTSPFGLCLSTQTFVTEPYFRHSCSTSAWISLKNSGSVAKLTWDMLNMPCSRIMFDVPAPIPPPGASAAGGRGGAPGRPPPSRCIFCISASRSLESLSMPCGPALPSSSKESKPPPALPMARLPAPGAPPGPDSPSCMSLVAIPTFNSLPANWKPFIAVMASRASEAFLNCTNAKPLHLLVYGSRCRSINSISPNGEKSFFNSSSEIFARESVRPPTYNRSGVSLGAVKEIAAFADCAARFFSACEG